MRGLVWTAAVAWTIAGCADEADDDLLYDARPRMTRDARVPADAARGDACGSACPDGATDARAADAGGEDGSSAADAQRDARTPSDGAVDADGPVGRDGAARDAAVEPGDGAPDARGDASEPPDGASAIDAAPPSDAEPPPSCDGMVCDDRSPCTRDACEGGRCVFVPAEAGEPCEDGDLCNGAETCDGAGACRPGGAVLCPDVDPCVDTRCDPDTGRCAQAPVPLCCDQGADCASDDPCVEARCDLERHTCVQERALDCCRGDEDCLAVGACVQAFCDRATARCATRPVAECCRADEECPEDAACTAYACRIGRCEATPIAGCCQLETDCPAGQGCEAARCRPLGELDRDDDGAPADVDCDDQDADRLPGAPEVCDGGVDEDCDQRIDADDPDCAPPPPVVTFAGLQFPREPVVACAGAASPLVYGRVYVAGRTPGAGAAAGVDAELGLGPRGSQPTAGGWLWAGGLYNSDLRNEFNELNDDEYRANFAFVPEGEWDLAWRFRLDGGPWTYADRMPGGSRDGYLPEQALHITGRSDCPPVGFAAIQFPREPVSICTGGDPVLVFGRVFVDRRTPGEGQAAGIDAQIGFGPDGADPGAESWAWSPGVYNGDLRNEFGQLNDDEYRASLQGVPAGAWDVAWRFRIDGGPWTYADLVPQGSTDGYQPERSLELSVRACAAPP